MIVATALSPSLTTVRLGGPDQRAPPGAAEKEKGGQGFSPPAGRALIAPRWITTAQPST